MGRGDRKGTMPDIFPPLEYEETVMCDRCERTQFLADNDLGEVVARHGPENWCRHCRMLATLDCVSCGNTYRLNNTDTQVDEVEDEGYFCQNCLENGPYSHCDDCEIWFNYELEDHDHASRRSERSGDIHNYSHKPEPEFHPVLPSWSFRWGTGPMPYRIDDYSKGQLCDYSGMPLNRADFAQFGVELETENQGNEDTRDIAREFMAKFDESILCLKEDSSLNDGFEIVTMPRSLASWREFSPVFGEALLGIRERGMRSWSASNAGLHIHASKIAFNGPSHVARFGLLFTQNEENWVHVAKRRSNNYASFDQMRDHGVVKSAKCQGGTSHFDAVNLDTADQPTVEVRIWRGSLAGAGRVIASIEFVAAAIEYTRDMTANDVLNGSLEWYKFAEFIKSNDYSQAQFVIDGGFYEASKVDS